MENENTKATEEERTELTKDEKRENLQNFNRELLQLQEKYECRLTAQLIVGENKVIPRVFAINDNK